MTHRRRLAVRLLATAVVAAAAAGATASVVPGFSVGAQSEQTCVTYWIQAGAFRSVDNATRLAADASRLAAPTGGPPFVVVTATVDGAPLYRVMSGPHPRADADIRIAQLRAAGLSTSLSTTSGPCAAEAPAAPAPTPAVPTFRVQVAAFSTPEAAQSLANWLNTQLAGLLPAGEFVVIPGVVDGTTLYRVQTQPRPQAEAEALLERMKLVEPAVRLVPA